MSEITSKSSTVNGSSLAPPVSKAGSVTEHDVLFAALFGGVVVAQQTVGQTSDSNDADAEENLDSSASILMAMQAITAMLSDKSGKTQNDQENSEEPTFIEGEISAEAVHADIKDLAEATYEVDETQLLNPAVIGPMIAQGPEYSTSLSSQPSNLMARMAFEGKGEGEGVPEKRWSTHIGASQMSKNIHLAGKGPLDSESTDEIMDDLKKSQGVRPEPVHKLLDKSVISRSHSQQINIPSRTPVTGPTFVGAEASGDGNNHFDSSDEFIQSISGRFERPVHRQVVDTAAGDTSPTNAARLALSAASAAGGQMSQQNNGQTSGQSGGSVNTGPGISNGNVMEMLDLAQDN